MTNPCLICGQHEAVTEYFDDDLIYYCPVHDTQVSEAEFDAEIARLEELSDEEMRALDEQEAIAYGWTDSHSGADDKGNRDVAEPGEGTVRADQTADTASSRT